MKTLLFALLVDLPDPISANNPPLSSTRRVPASELSINRLERLSACPGGSPIRTVLDSLDFPAYKVMDD